MTNQQIQDYITNSLNQQNKARGEYFAAQMEYAVALGRGTATHEQRLQVVALKEKSGAF